MLSLGNANCLLCGLPVLRKVGNRESLYSCYRCGLIHNLRSPNTTAEEARYQNVVFDSPESIARQQWEWLVQTGCRPGAKSRILDIGCGSGSFLLQAESHGLACWGIDISRAAVACARQRVGPDTKVTVGTVQDLEPGARFDVITLSENFSIRIAAIFSPTLRRFFSNFLPPKILDDRPTFSLC